MDISSKSPYPSNALSNFAPHPFEIDGVVCHSMEGFLQALKFKNPDMQKEICLLVGSGAKKSGSKKNWKTKQILYWQGKEYPRTSNEYSELIERAYQELAKNSGFKKALLSTKDAKLTHNMGRRKPQETVLTKQEFCKILTDIRTQLQS